VMKMVKNKSNPVVRQRTKKNNLQGKLLKCNVWPPFIILYSHIKCPKI
jgi:hypothetical protein